MNTDYIYEINWWSMANFLRNNENKNARNHIIENKEFKKLGLKSVIITTLAITYANPHVYLDTVVLLGSISANFYSKISFGSGAIISVLYFFSLGYFSKFLSKFIHSKKFGFTLIILWGF